jgi:hypothetical protein
MYILSGLFYEAASDSNRVAYHRCWKLSYRLLTFDTVPFKVRSKRRWTNKQDMFKVLYIIVSSKLILQKQPRVEKPSHQNM